MILKIKNFILDNKLLLSILLIAFLFRIILVGRDYPYLLNVDEAAFIRSTTGLRFNFIVDHFDWPHLGFYFHYIFYFLFIKFRGLIIAIGLKPVIDNVFPVFFEDPFIFYVLSKSINVILSILAGVPVFLVSKRLFNKSIALYSVLILFSMPYYLTSSLLATIDSPLVFFVMFSLYFMFLSLDRNSLKYSLLAGIFIGAAGSIKYNGLVFLPLYFAVVMYYLAKDDKGFLKNFIEAFMYFKFYSISFLTTIITFLFFNFSLFFRFDTFWSYKYGKGLLWQIFINSKTVPFDIYIKNVQELFTRSVDGVNFVAVLISMAGFLILLFDPKVKVKVFGPLKTFFILTLTFSIFYFLFFSKSAIAGPRYFVPLYGLIAVFMGYFCSVFINLIGNTFKKEKSQYNGDLIRIAIVVLILIPVIYESIISYKASTIVYALNYAKQNKRLIYIDTDKVYNIAEINQMGIRKYRGKAIPFEEVMTDKKSDNPNFDLKYTFVNDFRNGPEIYVYQVK